MNAPLATSNLSANHAFRALPYPAAPSRHRASCPGELRGAGGRAGRTRCLRSSQVAALLASRWMAESA